MAVSASQPAYQIGEALNLTIVYDMYYDPLDPLGAGSISVNVKLQGEEPPLLTHQFIDLGLSVNKSVSFTITPTDWKPNTTGQVGVIEVQGWVQDSLGTMTDTAELQFLVLQGDLSINTLPMPTKITYHDGIQLQGSLQDLHNSAILIPFHPLKVAISHDYIVCQEWELNTSQTSTFLQEINTSQIGTGTFQCNITALETEDYNSAMVFLSLSILNASLNLSPSVNATILQTYYPSTRNCSILISASLFCQSTNNPLQEANVSCTLNNTTTSMNYVSPNLFSTELMAPNVPGNYTVTITATLPHHNTTTSTIPIQVFPRYAMLSFEANCTEAALGDAIELRLSAKDKTSLATIHDKNCSLYIYNQSLWYLLSQINLDSNGTAQFLWQAQNVGNQDFQFKIIFHGGPEFVTGEREVLVINTHEIRFVLTSIIDVVRQQDVEYLLQLTTLDFQPLADVNVRFIEVSTNMTWSTATTNTSGYASLFWFIEEGYSLGIHEFQLIAQQGELIVGMIPITMIVFDRTTLELV